MSSDDIIKHFVLAEYVEKFKAGITVSTLSAAAEYHALKKMKSSEDKTDMDVFFRHAEIYVNSQLQPMPGFPMGLNREIQCYTFSIIRADTKDNSVNAEISSILEQIVHDSEDGLIAAQKGFSIGRLIIMAVHKNIKLFTTDPEKFFKSTKKSITDARKDMALGFPEGLSLRQCQKVIELFLLYKYQVFGRQYFPQ
ncbi:hypothetical protein ACFL0K_01195 [Patescibacteria group bacterium]